MTHERQDSGMREIYQAIRELGGDGYRELLRVVLEEVMKEEMTVAVGAGVYERTEGRTGYRNGYKPRVLNTRVGRLELEVPQDRGGLFHTEVFERYQRSEKALTLAIAESYVQGVSTRKIKKITEQLCGLEISKSQVSRLVERLSEEVEKWRKRKIEKEYRYLVVDARYEHVREEGAVQSCGVLLVVGISAEGYREILGVWCADSESENSWTEVFRDLKERGLRGVKYVVSDNHSGIKAAVDRCFQGAVEQLASTHRKVSEYLDEHGEEILGVYALPEKHRKRMRTTNLLERYNREVKRRTRVIGIFPNRESCIRLVSSMAMEQNEEWMEKRYLTMEEQETDSVPMVS